MEDTSFVVRRFFDGLFGTKEKPRSLRGDEVRDILLVVLSEVLKRLAERRFTIPTATGVTGIAAGRNIHYHRLEGVILAGLSECLQPLMDSKLADVETYRPSQTQEDDN